MDNNELLQAIYTELQDVKKNVQSIDTRVSNMETQMDNIDTRLTKIETTQENVINRNVQLLVEGVVGINDKLRRFDDLEEKVEDIQITVSVLKALTVK